MKKIGIILALFLGVLSAQAQGAFDFNCAPPTANVVVEGVYTHRGVVFDTNNNTLIVQGQEFERKGNVYHAPDGWSNPRFYNNVKFIHQEDTNGIFILYNGIGTTTVLASISQYNDVIDDLLDLKGPEMFFVDGRLSIGNRFLRNISGNGKDFLTDAGSTFFGSDVIGHIEVSIQNDRTWNIDLRIGATNPRIYRSGLVWEEFMSAMRTVIADYDSTYPQLSIGAGYNHEDQAFWYKSRRWERDRNSNLWYQPAGFSDNNIKIIRDDNNTWYVKYTWRGQTTTSNALELIEVIAEIQNILNNY